MRDASSSRAFPEDRVVLVTGATGGIGRATARAFAAAGDRLALQWRHDAAGAEELLEELGGASGRHRTYRADLADPEAARELIAAVVREQGRIDVLVNNAGIFEEVDVLRDGPEVWEENWKRTLDVNLLGPARLLFWAARQFAERGEGGTIVNVSSRGAFRGEPSAPAYGASKAGLNALGQSMARALAPHGIGVFTLAPGFVETPMAAPFLEGGAGREIRDQSPFGRVARPEEVAWWAVSCTAPEARFATGSIVDVNGASYLRS